MPIDVEEPDPDGACSLQGKVAVVTGGAGSIGSAVVARLVAEGVRVVAVDQDRPPDPAAVGVNYLRGDVAHPATAARAVATAEAAFGGLDLLVNAVRPENSPGEQLAYAVSRDAVVALSRHLAVALEPLGIGVECVDSGAAPDGGGCPGGDCPDKDVAAAVLRLLWTAAARSAGRTLA